MNVSHTQKYEKNVFFYEISAADIPQRGQIEKERGKSLLLLYTFVVATAFNAVPSSP